VLQHVQNGLDVIKVIVGQAVLVLFHLLLVLNGAIQHYHMEKSFVQKIKIVMDVGVVQVHVVFNQYIGFFVILFK
jgi:hypothetical protein